MAFYCEECHLQDTRCIGTGVHSYTYIGLGCTAGCSRLWQVHDDAGLVWLAPPSQETSITPITMCAEHLENFRR